MKLVFTFLLCANIAFGQYWTQLPDFPGLQRDDAVAVTINGKGYFGTGLKSDLTYGDEFYILDPASNTWSVIPPIPLGRQYASAFAGTNSFFVFGGYGANGPLNDLYKYDITAGTWSLAATKPGNTVFGANCLAFGDKVIIVGGKAQSNLAPSNEVWEYTISSNTWQQKNNFPYGGRFRASAAVLNGTGYLLFGVDDNSHFRKEFYSYDQVADSWTKIMDFPEPAARVYATLQAVNNKLILFGGIDSTLTCYKNVWYYHPDNASWTPGPDFPSFSRKGGMGTVIGNTFYYSCGIDQNNNRLKETWMTDVPVGIKENKEDVIVISPNPAQDLIYLQLKPGQAKSISLVDLSGKEIKWVVITTTVETQQINIAHLCNGVYFLKIINADETVAWRKIIKNDG